MLGRKALQRSTAFDDFDEQPRRLLAERDARRCEVRRERIHLAIDDDREVRIRRVHAHVDADERAEL